MEHEEGVEDKDAWEQELDLHERYTKEFQARPDVTVLANGCGRHIMLTLREVRDPLDGDGLLRYRYHERHCTVMAAREIAQALLDAADFVEAANPTWAHHGHGSTQEGQDL